MFSYVPGNYFDALKTNSFYRLINKISQQSSAIVACKQSQIDE
ncbi:hypothetical protein [Virgibacillus halodenitrificans]|nr:hypothetical protein [Virgibacillus halodenitrificans]